MRTNYFKGISLKTKMALAVTSLFILFVIATSYLTFSYFERTLKESISAQQFSLVSSLANTIDAKLRIAQNTLLAVASTVPQDTLANAENAQRFLDKTTGFHSIFDNNISFISTEGKLIAESRYLPGRRGKDLSYREWVQKTVATRKPYISDPYVSTHIPIHPAIVMTVPIFDGRGRMAGMLVGSIDLLGGNFLADLSRTRIGNSGYLFIADRNRILVVHPDKSRIMKQAAPPGVNKLVDQAFNGFEGSGETVTSYGVPMLLSCKQLKMASWFLAANYPISEAYAPLYKAEKYFFITVFVVAAMLLAITWLIMKRLMLPLATMTGHVKHLPEKPRHEQHIIIDTEDEIGVLATAFNKMIDTLNTQQESLRERKERYREQAVLLESEMAERQVAQEALAVKQLQLEKVICMLQELNYELEERISKAVLELRQKDRILIQQNRQAAMGEMVNNIAHQWRQPLNNIGLIVQNLMYSHESGELSEDMMKADVGKTMETIKFMSQTIDDFRNYFKPDKELSRFSIKLVVERTISIIEGSVGNIQITIQIDETDDHVLFGYPNEYSQVVLNILLNAKDVLSERKISDPEIRVTIRTENGKSVVTISDNAGGIPEDIIGRIFEPYFSTKGPDIGTGIGLFMSKNIIEENMNGKLTAYNSGQGAEFRIEVPLFA
ncbi:MAG TPA: cache domain-containing protein [Dongiaceae bacterium]|nr:cache domain-containing protein [Dongiaceae bacterium]